MVKKQKLKIVFQDTAGIDALARITQRDRLEVIGDALRVYERVLCEQSRGSVVSFVREHSLTVREFVGMIREQEFAKQYFLQRFGNEPMTPTGGVEIRPAEVAGVPPAESGAASKARSATGQH